MATQAVSPPHLYHQPLVIWPHTAKKNWEAVVATTQAQCVPVVGGIRPATLRYGGQGEAPGVAGSIDRLSCVPLVIVVLISVADASSQCSARRNKHTYLLTNRHHLSSTPSFLLVLIFDCCFCLFLRLLPISSTRFSSPKHSGIKTFLQINSQAYFILDFSESVILLH
ncbi:hypothetical protein PspLS_03764 [Pyricularia sp. CBS 133598]|nr:hypothetical protein PspLS_03764 [Pyricularia sp. CBS 133598]